MKHRLAPVLLVLLVTLFFGCAGSSQYMSTAATPPPAGPSPDKALVYIMRPSGMGFAINFQIYHSDELIGLSQAKSFFTYECDPGTHMFLGIAENKHGLKAELEAGKTYFVLTQVKMGAWKARMAMIPVTAGSEWWDKVDGYKTSLHYIISDKAKLDSWKAANVIKADAVLKDTYAFLETPEGQKYVAILKMEDGR
jgi:hypothetical protein